MKLLAIAEAFNKGKNLLTGFISCVIQPKEANYSVVFP